MNKKEDIQEIVREATESVATLRKHVSVLEQLSKENKNDSISATLEEIITDKKRHLCTEDKRFLMDQLRYALHWYASSNQIFNYYLEQHIPNDDEGYDKYVKSMKDGAGINGDNMGYIICAIRYVLVENEPATVIVEDEKLRTEIQDAFGEIGNLLGFTISTTSNGATFSVLNPKTN